MQQAVLSSSKAYMVALAVPCALIAAVYVAQFGFGLPPCEMCWWQRYPHFAAIALAGAASTARGTRLGDALVRLGWWVWQVADWRPARSWLQDHV